MFLRDSATILLLEWIYSTKWFQHYAKWFIVWENRVWSFPRITVNLEVKKLLLGKYNYPEKNFTKKCENGKLSKQSRRPITVKQVKRLIGSVHFFRNLHPYLGQKFFLFYKVWLKENAFTITNDHHDSINTLKADLKRATDLTFI